MDTQGTTHYLPLGGRALTRRGLLLGSAAAALALAGCGGGSDRPWEGEPGSTAGLKGYVDASGGWAIAPRWARAFGFQDAAALVAWADEDPRYLWVSVVDASGRWAFEPLSAMELGEPGEDGPFSCGLVPVYHNGWRYMDWHGSFLGDADGLGDDGRFYEVGPFSPPDAFMGRPYALADRDGRWWGVLGADGGWLLRPEFGGHRLRGAGPDAGAALLPAARGTTYADDVPWGYIAPDGSWAVEPALAACV